MRAPAVAMGRLAPFSALRAEPAEHRVRVTQGRQGGSASLSARVERD